MSRDQIILSLDSRHAEKIFRGVKKVELRRRTMNITPGTIAWIYVKMPVGSVIGRVKIESVYNDSPMTIWSRYKSVSGLTKKEYFEYFSNSSRGTALMLKDPKLLKNSISLVEMRAVSENFQPPQFFKRLYDRCPILNNFFGTGLIFRSQSRGRA